MDGAPGRGYNVAMISVDTRELHRLESDLILFRERALPFATKNTLDKMAFEGRSKWQGRISGSMVERNKFTRSSVRVEKAKGLNINTQESAVGSVAPYMATQEHGGAVANRGKRKPLPTSASAGLAQTAKPRTKLPRASNRLRGRPIPKRPRPGRTRGQRIAQAAFNAIKHDEQFIYFEGSIFRIRGRIVASRVVGLRMTMMHDLSERSYTVPASPTMGPAVREVPDLAPRFYRDALLFQLKRNRIMNYK